MYNILSSIEWNQWSIVVDEWCNKGSMGFGASASARAKGNLKVGAKGMETGLAGDTVES